MKKFLIGFVVVLAIWCSYLAFQDAAENYNVSNVVYTFDAFDPASIASIAFDLDAPANVVAISLGDKFFLCESADPFTHWTCPVQGVTISSKMNMRVVVK